jgi:pimeloyl-ACP methyl ester carboxylesterase
MRRLVIAVVALLIIVIIGAAAWVYTPDKPRAALEARYAGPPSAFIEVAGLRMHVRDTGPREAPAIILLHGFGASLHTWDDWASNLAADHRVIRFDLPGFALTGPDPTGDYTDARSISVVRALMDRLGVARATFVGNSMGGRIAWTFAATFPERVRGVVLMAPDGFASPGLAYGVAPDVPWMMRVLPYVMPTPLLRATLAPAYADRSVISDELVARYRDMMLAPGVRSAIVDRLPQTVLTDPEPLLRRIKAPTLLLWGEKDAMVPFTNAADYLRAIQGARLVSFSDVGHLPQEEAPGRSLEVLRAFLAEQR